MSRRRKKAQLPDPSPQAPKAPEKLARPFAQALAGVRAEPPAPANRPAAPPPRPEPPKAREAPERPYEERVALSQAYAGVQPLEAQPRHRRNSKRVAPRPAANTARLAAEATARARLASLVTGGLTFDVQRDAEGWVQGVRRDARGRPLDDLRDGRATAEAELDLHGLRADDAEAALLRFLRHERQRGRLIVRVIHGKGRHSDGGVGVLGDRVLESITQGQAAPLVDAFITASLADGGAGALLVRLHS